MKIQGPSLPPRVFIEQTKADALQNLRAGQVLKATVLSDNTDGSLKLAIAKAIVTAQTSLKLPQGTELKLEVVRAGAQPEFKALLPQPRETAQVQAQALRNALPQAVPLPKAIDTLVQMMQRPEAATLPQPVIQALRIVLDQRLTSPQLQETTKLAEQIKVSGQFLERSLLQGKPATNDFKLSLLRLFSLLQNLSGPSSDNASPAVRQAMADAAQTLLAKTAMPTSPSTETKPETSRPQAEQPASQAQTTRPSAPLLDEIRTAVEGALARIKLNQLASLPQENVRPVLQLELPVLAGDNTEAVGIVIEQEQQGAKADNATDGWNVSLQFEFASLGKVKAMLNLRGETLNTRFVAERLETVQLFRDNFDRLRRSLEKLGLEVNGLEINQGRLATPEPVPSSTRLLDEKA